MKFTEQEIFVMADRALEQVVSQIKPEQYTQIVPPEITTRQPGSSLRQIINYHAYDDSWVPDTLAGKTAAQVGAKYDGDLLGTDPADSFSRVVDRAVKAVERFREPERVVHLSYGDFPARDYLIHITSFRGFRAYDIAKFIGADTTLPADLVQGMWDELSPHWEEYRAMGVFGPAVETPPHADLQARLLALSGRNPAA
ncbi:MAG TPA: TIGR03086 family protein [Candidatus Saccharimonadia bacterium]|nr:TIGR03086 family protein [Candidatus Saccharimonadia bacterium]